MIHHRRMRACFAFAALTNAVTAHADLPLTIDDLITDKGKVKLDTSLAYANSSQQGINTGEPILVQTGPTSFVAIPTQIGEMRSQTDALVGTLGLRYGVSSNAEAYTRLSYFTSQTRRAVGPVNTSDTTNQFADAWLGLNYRFREDAEKPALLGFAEIALRERHESDAARFKSGLIGLTTYRAIDPVVLTLTGAYRYNATRRDGSDDYQPGNFFLLNPQVAFAVNDRITLITGLQWKSQQADHRNDQALGLRRTGSDWTLGLGYGLSVATIMNLTTSSSQAGGDSADIRLNLLHTLGKGTGKRNPKHSDVQPTKEM